MADNTPQECLSCPLGPPDWEYVCRNCRQKFIMPVPKGPTEEKSRVCPFCKNADIERIKTEKTESCPPGG